MPDTKLTALSEISVPALEDLLYLVDDPAGTPTSGKVTIQNLINLAAMVKIAENLLGADAASVTFNSIPSGYRHLSLVGYGRLTGVGDYIYVRFNNDSTANYDHQRFVPTNGAATNVAAYADTKAPLGLFPGTDATRATMTGSIDAIIAHYAGTTFEKSVQSRMGDVQGTSGNNVQVGILAGFWRSVAAITRVDVLPGTGNFKAGSIFSLYGLR